MTASCEYARIVIQIDLSITLKHDHVGFNGLDVVRRAVLAERHVRASLAANRGALASASKLLLASSGAWQPIARGGARHIALRMGATRATLLFRARRTRLVTLLVAGSVCTPHVAFDLAERTWFVAMTACFAAMLARGVIALTRLPATAVIRCNDYSVFASAALVAFLLTDVAAWEYRSANRRATISFTVRIDVAHLGHFVLASRNCRTDRFFADNLRKVLILVARQ